MKLVIALVASVTLFVWVKQAPLDTNTRTNITSQAYRDLDRGVSVLTDCDYFKTKYPWAYDKLRTTKVEIVILRTYITGVCAAAPFDMNTIFIFPSAWRELSPGCDVGAPLLAHEYLHILGLPPHKQYDTYGEYEAQDPIEIVITKCFGKAGKR